MLADARAEWKWGGGTPNPEMQGFWVGMCGSGLPQGDNFVRKGFLLGLFLCAGPRASNVVKKVRAVRMRCEPPPPPPQRRWHSRTGVDGLQAVPSGASKCS